MNKHYFHFTLGPVQGFVSQARRTRDFWAGSFLLSWLSAVAIKAVEKQKGELLFPKVEENYLNWLENKALKNTDPQQGCIPNCFKGRVAKVPQGFDPQIIEHSVKQAWQGLAEDVWLKDLEAHYLAQSKKNAELKTRKIWDRQIEGFWEISWVLTDNEKQGDLLDKRKNWRSYLPPEEAGVKCMMMDGWQELSGINTPHHDGLELFWKTLRQRNGSLEGDLREGEYLCAIAFIKRRFAHCFKGFKQTMPNNWDLHGWEVTPSVPSVSYMAAAPWLAQIIEYAPEKELFDFLDKANKLTKSYGECKTKLQCVQNAIYQKGYSLELWKLKSLDGDVFFESALDNKNRHPDQQQAQEVKKALTALRTKTNEIAKNVNLEPVSPFYAVLMMDGDSLGSQMSDLNKQTSISDSLNHFTKHVNPVVEEHSGFLIYVGGDDVLALLPLEFALNCAYALRQLYAESFKEKGRYKKEDGTEATVKSTLSGAIEYAHIKIPLTKILADARSLLDDIAKNGCGCDAIAVRVWKQGGRHLQWAMPWKEAINKDTDKVVLNEIVDEFRQIDNQTPFSNSFFFNIEERFAMLQHKKENGELELAEGFNEEVITKLIAAEFLNSGVNQNRKPKLNLEDAKKMITPLIKQCLPVKRIFEEGVEKKPQSLNYLNTDGAHLIRFLVKKGVENG